MIWRKALSDLSVVFGSMGLLALVGMFSSSNGVAAPANYYSYVDDFSTNNAQVDSYSHSPFADPLPELSFYSVIGYGACPGGSRALGFICGFELDVDAFISYRLPLTPESGNFWTGAINFDACRDRGSFHFLRITVSYYGSAGGFSNNLLQPGHYGFPLSPAQECDSLLILFEGDQVLLDDLRVDLYAIDPTDPSTWGAIKSLYR